MQKKIDEKRKAPDAPSPDRTPLSTLRTWAATISYKEGDKNPVAAELFSQHGFGEDHFNKFLQLKPKTKAQDIYIPAIYVDGAEIDLPDFYIRKLESTAENRFEGALAMIIGHGKFSACCQKMGGEGETCARHSYESEYGACFVLCRKKPHVKRRKNILDDEILGASWTFVAEDDDKILVMDSIESNNLFRDKKENRIIVSKMFRFAAFQLVTKHGFKAVFAGGDSGGQAQLPGFSPDKPHNSIDKENMKKPKGYYEIYGKDAHRDSSRSQLILCQQNDLKDTYFIFDMVDKIKTDTFDGTKDIFLFYGSQFIDLMFEFRASKILSLMLQQSKKDFDSLIKLTPRIVNTQDDKMLGKFFEFIEGMLDKKVVAEILSVALSSAAVYRSKTLIDLLLAKGADPNNHNAIEAQYITKHCALKYYLGKEALKEKQKDASASEAFSLEMFKTLYNKTDPKSQAEVSNFLLTKIFCNSSPTLSQPQQDRDIFNYLLSVHGPKLKVQSGNHVTFIGGVYIKDHTLAIKLLEQGASSANEVISSSSNETLFERAVIDKAYDFLEILLKKGFKMHAPIYLYYNHGEDLPFNFVMAMAKHRNDLSPVKMLLKYGADPTRKNSRGDSAERFLPYEWQVYITPFEAELRELFTEQKQRVKAAVTMQSQFRAFKARQLRKNLEKESAYRPLRLK